MSIRIHALAKELNVPSKDLIDFINSRKEVYGLEIKTSSNAIAPLYADTIKSDFLKEQQAPENAEAEAAPAQPAPSQPEPAGATGAGGEAGAAEESQPSGASEPSSAPAEPAPTAEAPKGDAEPAAVSEPQAERPRAEAPATAPAASIPSAPSQRAAAPKVPPAIPPMPSIKRPAPLQMPSMARKSPPQVQMPRARISMPPVSSAPKKEERDSQPEVVVKMDSPAPKVPPLPPRMASVPPPVPTRRAAPAITPPPLSQSTASNETAAEGAQKKVLVIKPPIIVRDFAKLMDVKPFRLISELMDMGIFASMNQAIDEPVAIKIGARHGYELDIKHRGEQFQQQLRAEAEKKAAKKKLEEDLSNYVPRPPIVCILGHVDHGKTTLLDTIRNTNVVAGEAGGITQHTAAYQVECDGKKITFLDTPGHAAFSKMRERGANVTDVAILVVAADDGFMPQTDEALAFAQKAGVPVVVAINKIDAKGANIDRVKQQMQKRGITSEDWGGEVLCQPISALKGENIDKLLEQVLLQAEMSELKANPKGVLDGVIIESQLEPGRGATATVIVKNGTLKAGDVIICGENWCKVRALLDDKGRKMQSASPSTPAVVMGWTGAPEAGENFKKVDSDRHARKLADEAALERKKAASQNVAPKMTSVEELMAAIEHKEQKTFKCIVKSDVSGTVEALEECLKAIKSDKVALEVIDGSVGQITKTDVAFASTAGASIVAFNVKEENGVAGLAKHKGVQIITHNIIYELINRVRDSMKDLLEPELKENKLGAAEVRALFTVSKGGRVAGCMVTEGLVKRDKFSRVFRKGKEVASGKISALKRFKDDVAEVRAGYECGLSMNNFDEFEPGDIVECFEILEIRPEL